MGKKFEMKSIETPIGELYFRISKKGLQQLTFSEIESQCESESILSLLQKELSLYFQGILKEFTVPLDLHGTEFQIQVWNEIQNIPYGKTITYKQQAQQMDRKNAIRAIASANGRNPVLIVIPCHRIIGTNGKLTGYAGGVDKKQRLLNLEKGQKEITQFNII